MREKIGIKEYKNKDIKYFIRISIFIYIVLEAVFLIFIYQFSRNYIISEIDKRLEVAAESIKHILPEDYHDRAVGPDKIPQYEWNIIERKLSSFADKLGFEYIWTDVEIGGEYYLTSCNRNDKYAEQTPEIYYFMKYNNGVSEAEKKAFDSDKPLFTFLYDKWGNFRTVFIPTISPYGNKYLSCAEYTIDYVAELIKNGALFTFIVSLLLFLIFVPVFSVYIFYAGRKEKELKNKNRELEESSSNLNITLHSISDGVIVTDSTGIIKIMNKPAEIITGCVFSDCAGKTISDKLKFYDPITKNEMPNPVFEVINSESYVIRNQTAIILINDNLSKRITRTSSPIINNEGVITGVITVLRDVTEQHRLEEELRQSQNIESVGQLAGGIAHDFNNMLGAVLSSAELLDYHVKDSTAKEYIKIIIDITHKAAELTSNLLTFSRKNIKKIEVFNVNRAINNVVSILQRNFNKNIVIKTYLNAENKYIKGDIGDVENSIYNIAINSRDAMPFGGFLDFFTENVYLDQKFCDNTVFDISEGNYILIKIKDSGSGMSDEVRKKIFEPYFTTKENNSSGIGLSVVYGTVLEHRGAVYADKSDDEGTVISLYFPTVEK